MKPPRTLFAKLWDMHLVATLDDGMELLHIDRIVLHERAGAMCMRQLAKTGRRVHDPSQVFGIMDHVLDTRPGRSDATTLIPNGQKFIEVFRAEAKAAGFTLFDLGDTRQGIAHVSMPEQGVALPGMSLVCADSHTGTIGGIGALAWGIGISEMEHALATQTIALKRPQTMRIWIGGGEIGDAVFAKDIVLHLIGQIGAAGAVGYAVEYAGPAVRAMSVEGRMTLCNMAVECGAWSAFVAPDATTLDWLAGRPFAPSGAMWECAGAAWSDLKSDDGATFDAEARIDVADLVPQVSWGTSPEHVAAVDGAAPHLATIANPVARGATEAALRYMGIAPGQLLSDLPIDAVFIGSCTNARLSDLRAAAALLRGRRIAATIIKAIVVPGSSEVKRQAEAEGLHTLFRDAGFEWRESGCSLCFYGGGEGFPPMARVASTTNRNFENRQGPGIRTHLMSPATAAASALAGRLSDPRKVMT